MNKLLEGFAAILVATDSEMARLYADPDAQTITRRVMVCAIAALGDLLFYCLAILAVPLIGGIVFVAAAFVVGVYDLGHPAAGFVAMTHVPFLTDAWWNFFKLVGIAAMVDFCAITALKKIVNQRLARSIVSSR